MNYDKTILDHCIYQEGFNQCPRCRTNFTLHNYGGWLRSVKSYQCRECHFRYTAQWAEAPYEGVPIKVEINQ